MFCKALSYYPLLAAERQQTFRKLKERSTEMTESTQTNAVFASEAVFRRKLKSYVKHCSNEKARRLPNAAGFCRFCSISRNDFAHLKVAFPLMFDIAQSTFIDEALNTKFPNSAANMSFITDFNNSISGEGKDTVRIICEHDPSCDGE